MNETSADTEQAIEKLLGKVRQIATLPEVTAQIIELVEDPETCTEDMQQLISRDPALSTRVLKVVNSAFYGVPGTVGTIERAIVLLGLNSVRNIAVATSFSKFIHNGLACPSFRVGDLLEHSTAVAAAARLISEHLGEDESSAFLIGMLHDVGIMVEMQAMQAGFAALIEARTANPAQTFRETERLVIGATHEQIGMALCKKWNFPDVFQYAVGYHHDPMKLQGEHRRIAGIICVADHLAADVGYHYHDIIGGEEMPPGILDELALSAATIESIRDRLPDAAGLASELMG